MMPTTTMRRRKSATTAAVAMTALMVGLSVTEGALAQQPQVQRARRAAADERIINRVAFEGNSKVEKAIFEQEVQTKARTAYNPAAVDADVQRILEIYRRTGRSLATVTPRVVDLANGRVDVVFTINEGDKTGVKEIRFVGNNSISSSRLRGVMTTTESNLLSFLKNSDIYDPDRLASDQELIRRYYLKNGYADFRIVSADAQFDPSAGGYIITIAVDEGPQYRVGTVNLGLAYPRYRHECPPEPDRDFLGRRL